IAVGVTLSLMVNLLLLQLAAMHNKQRRIAEQEIMIPLIQPTLMQPTLIPPLKTPKSQPPAPPVETKRIARRGAKIPVAGAIVAPSPETGAVTPTVPTPAPTEATAPQKEIPIDTRGVAVDVSRALAGIDREDREKPVSQL